MAPPHPGTVPEHRKQARSVTLVVLVILAVVWAVYLVSWVRSRTEHRRVNSINSFSRHLSVLERTGPGGANEVRALGATAMAGPVVGPSPRRPTLSQAKKRRRDVLVGLLAGTGVTFLGAVLLRGTVVYLFGLSLCLTVAYVVALASIQKRALERRAKVRRLDQPSLRPTAWADDAWAAEADLDEGYGYDVGRVYAVQGR
jgi:hypothetical protein